MENPPFNPAVTSGAHESLWLASETQQDYPALSGNTATEVLVVGGGIAGLTTAYCLAQAGKRVIVIDDGNIGSGESGRTTAQISYALDDRYYDLENIFNKEKAALAAQSHMVALNWIANTVETENIPCDFTRVDGYLFLHQSDKEENLDKEYDATRSVGLPTQMVTSIPGIENAPERAILFPEQGQFHIIKYLNGLAAAIVRMGGKIYSKTRAEEVTKEGAKANGFDISADHIVVATNTPINDMFTMHTKQSPYRSYVLAGKVKKGALPYAMWWDTGDQDSKWPSFPYHYVRLAAFNEEYDLLVSGGEDHKTGQADAEGISEEQRYLNLESWTRQHFPQMEAIEYHWSGQVMEPVDGLAFLGKNPGDENIYIITGDSGNGMTHGTLGGLIICDLIRGLQNPYAELYDPARITLSAASTFVKEQANVFKQYLDLLTPEALKKAEDLAPGTGGILTSGLSKKAVYRDETGKLEIFSALCPHMGCVVQWNGDEKSFDCPCHGSRFDCGGHVLNGPAISDLKKEI